MRAYFNKIANSFRRSLSFFNLTGSKENEKSNLIDNKKARTLDGKGFSVVNTEILTTSSIIQNTTQNQVYDALDVAEGFAYAHEQISDLGVLLVDIKRDYEELIKYLKIKYKIPDSTGADLSRLIRMTVEKKDLSLEYSKKAEMSYRV